MTDSERDPMLLDHAYDDIQEYDNPLPGWWRWLWTLSIFFSVCYFAHYHFGMGPSIHENYQAEVARHAEKLLAQLGDIQADNATIIKYMNNEEWMTASAGMYVGNCGQCHAADGGGGVGPNLCDDYFKNVKEPKDIFTVITKGVAGKAMQPWEDRMSKPQRILLSAYVASLRGTAPAKGKAVEGVVIPEWDTFVEAHELEAEDSGAELEDAS